MLRKFDLVRVRSDLICKDFDKSKEFTAFSDAVKKIAGGNITIEKTGQHVIIWQTEKPAKNGKG
jgi:hypothetical protein